MTVEITIEKATIKEAIINMRFIFF